MLEHIVENHKIDSIFWTGDNSPHNTWDNTNEEVTMYTQLITSEIKKAFEGVDVPVYPSTGNHDTWPVNNQDFNEPNSNYPINHFVDDWKEWIGDEAAEEFAKYGYCSIPFKLPGGKLLEGSRVLIMQTQVANQGNFYLPGQKYDPAGHLSWLEEQLKQIEADQGLAYIAGHVQPFNFTLQFGARYQALMERYQHIVRVGLYGHTHDQYWSVTKSVTNPEKVIGFNQVGPSGTTGMMENPSYALVDVDEETMMPVNWRIFYMDLE